ncbi:MAG: 6-bladed beta-propeller [Rhodothermales bacterium]
MSPCQPITSFGKVESIATDSEGHIYVADGASMSIRVFDKNGRYVRTIGSHGRGPS